MPGRDFSGVVAALGKGANDFKVGDAVFGVCEVPREGAYAEKIAIRQEIVARKPESLSHVQAAAVALAGLTALISLEDTLKLKAGETDPDPGRRGRGRGLRDRARQAPRRARDHHRERGEPRYVRKLGADQVIDYREQDFTKLVSGVDAVFDTVGGDVTRRASRCCARAGASRAWPWADAPPSPRSDVTSLRPKVNRDRPHLDASASWSRKASCRARDRRVSARQGRRRSPRERGAPPARQAGAQGAFEKKGCDLFS